MFSYACGRAVADRLKTDLVLDLSSYAKYYRKYSLSRFNIIDTQKNDMKKTIKIFLASSITEFEKERNELEVFIRRISDIYEDNYDISLNPISCEAIDPYITDSRTQDIINETLKDTELCIVLVYTRFGAFTNEEFKYALNLFRESNHKLPKIYVNLKN